MARSRDPVPPPDDVIPEPGADVPAGMPAAFWIPEPGADVPAGMPAAFWRDGAASLHDRAASESKDGAIALRCARRISGLLSEGFDPATHGCVIRDLRMLRP